MYVGLCVLERAPILGNKAFVFGTCHILWTSSASNMGIFPYVYDITEVLDYLISQ